MLFRSAKTAIDNVAFACKLKKQLCVTAELNIHGHKINMDYTDALNMYGSDAEKIKQLIIDQSVLAEKIHKSLPYTKAEVVWAVKEEMAITVEDVLARRTRALFIDAGAAIQAAPLVANLMAAILQKNYDWQQQQVKAFTAVANNYLLQ